MIKKIDCRKCVHFHITWEDSLPFGCRAFGIKSRQIPSMVVSRHSGTMCLLYKPKKLDTTGVNHG